LKNNRLSITDVGHSITFIAHLPGSIFLSNENLSAITSQSIRDVYFVNQIFELLHHPKSIQSFFKSLTREA